METFKLQRFHADWNKLLESDDEDEAALIEDLSSTLRQYDINDQSDEPLSEVSPTEAVSELLPQDTSEVETSAFTALIGSQELQLTNKEEVQQDFDSGLDLASVSSVAEKFTAPLTYSMVTKGTKPMEHSKRKYEELLLTPQSTPVRGTKSKSSRIESPDIGIRSSSRASSISSMSVASITEPVPKHPRLTSKEFETDAEIIKRRQKQIDYGKNTISYQNYIESIPPNKRTKKDIFTPDKYIKFSRRSWDQQIKIWRKRIHGYDSTESSVPPSSVKKSLDFEEKPTKEVIANVDKKELNGANASESSKEEVAVKIEEDFDIDISGMVDF